MLTDLTSTLEEDLVELLVGYELEGGGGGGGREKRRGRES